jgi:hypothetical protein
MSSRWKTVLSLVVVFAAGVIVGGVLMLKGIQRWHREKINAANWTPRTMHWLRREVAVTPEQESTVLPIVERAMGDLSQLRDQADGERKAIFARLFLELSEHLSAEQQAKMKDSVARAQAAGVGP